MKLIIVLREDVVDKTQATNIVQIFKQAHPTAEIKAVLRDEL